MSDALVFPQPGDEGDAAFFAFLAGTRPETDGIISGFEITDVDFVTDEVTVTRGKAVLTQDSMTSVAANVDPDKTVDDVVRAVQYPGRSEISVSSSGINELYLNPRFDQSNDPHIQVNPATTTDKLKVGEVDTSAQTVSEQWNLIRSDGTLSYPDADAANTALQSLPTGVTVIDRSNGVRITGGSIEADGFGADAAESIQDIVGGLVVGQNDADVSYDDSAEQLSIDVSTLTNEEVEDTVASVVSSGTNLSWSYDDANDTLTVSLTDSISVGTIESGSADITDEFGIPIYSDSINAPQREGNLIRVDGGSSQIAGLYIHDGSSYVKAGKTEDKVRELAYSVHRRQSL
jgi:hypothetical protein